MLPGGGGTPLYGLCKYVRPQRGGLFSRSGHKEGIDFSHFALLSIGYGFSTLVFNWVCFLKKLLFHQYQ